MGVVTLMPRRESGNVLPVGGSGAGSSRGRENREESTSSERHGENGTQEEDVRGIGRDSTLLGITHIPLFPPLTTYRAHMLLMTAICILAVDFPVFPRSLVKCETFGVSIASPHFLDVRAIP